jgi:hypothetical protein
MRSKFRLVLSVCSGPALRVFALLDPLGCHASFRRWLPREVLKRRAHDAPSDKATVRDFRRSLRQIQTVPDLTNTPDQVIYQGCAPPDFPSRSLWAACRGRREIFAKGRRALLGSGRIFRRASSTRGRELFRDFGQRAFWLSCEGDKSQTPPFEPIEVP